MLHWSVIILSNFWSCLGSTYCTPSCREMNGLYRMIYTALFDLPLDTLSYEIQTCETGCHVPWSNDLHTDQKTSHWDSWVCMVTPCRCHSQSMVPSVRSLLLFENPHKLSHWLYAASEEVERLQHGHRNHSCPLEPEKKQHKSIWQGRGWFPISRVSPLSRSENQIALLVQPSPE